MRRPSSRRNAPGIPGAFVLALTLLFLGCEKDTTKPWDGESVATEIEEKQSSGESPADKPTPTAPGKKKEKPPEQGSPDEIRFVSFNLENWLTMDRYVDRKPVGSNPKPESERAACVTLLKRVRPDILGICEVGTRDDLTDLQSRLKKTGVDLPHAHHTGGVDDTRRLAILSRFPITSTEIREDLNYELDGRTRGMGRGILDATVDTPIGAMRFIGVHLKSKREIPDADQELMRRAEAHLLRRTADQIISADEDTPLVVYGDMNDTRQSSAIRTIRGPRDGPKSLKMAWLKDSRGDTWTHFWSYQDVYSRFDYVFVTPNLLDHVRWDDCRVLDDPEWADASDHRALLMIFE